MSYENLVARLRVKAPKLAGRKLGNSLNPSGQQNHLFDMLFPPPDVSSIQGLGKISVQQIGYGHHNRDVEREKMKNSEGRVHEGTPSSRQNPPHLCLGDQFAFQPRKNAGTVHLAGDDYVFPSRSELLGNLACAFGRAQEQEPKIVGMMFDKLSAKRQGRQLKSAILASRQEWA